MKPYVLIVIAVAVLFYLGMEILSQPTDQQQHAQVIKGPDHNETIKDNSPVRGISDDHKFELTPDPWGNDPPVSTKTYSVAMLADNEDIIPPGTQLFFAGRLSGYTTAWANTGGIGHFAPVALIVDDVEKSLDRTVLCWIPEKEAVEVETLYPARTVVSVYGRYIKFMGINDRDKMLRFQNCNIATDVGHVVRPERSSIPVDSESRAASDDVVYNVGGDIVSAPKADETGIVHDVGGKVSAPKAVFAPDAVYSDEARKAKLQGTCTLELVVGPDGHTRDIRVTRPLGGGLDEKAIEAIQQWRFEPATMAGKPVAARITAEVNFRLY